MMIKKYFEQPLSNREYADNSVRSNVDIIKMTLNNNLLKKVLNVAVGQTTFPKTYHPSCNMFFKINVILYLYNKKVTQSRVVQCTLFCVNSPAHVVMTTLF